MARKGSSKTSQTKPEQTAAPPEQQLPSASTIETTIPPAAPVSAENAVDPGPTHTRAVISLPKLIDPPEGGYMTAHVDVQLNQQQRFTLKQLFWSLAAAGVNVRSQNDAVKWLLDQVAAASR